MSDGYSFLFGPVRSRRLGRSLGIDLVPLKVCTYDCPYCQVGVTTDKTLARREYVPVSAVLSEFDHWLAHDGKADCVTLAGGGEPTLHSRFGEVIEAVGARSGLRRILLSNGSLFFLPEVRASAAKAEVVKATLSAWDTASYQAAHHPHPELGFDGFVAGLKAMRTGFRGEYWLEVFVIPGVNDLPEQVERIARLAREIAPDRIHLNTAVRPARDGVTQAVSALKLEALAGLFSPVAEVVVSNASVPEMVSTSSGWTATSGRGQTPPGGRRPPDGCLDNENVSAAALAERIMALIHRHPCTVADMAVTVGMPPAALEKPLADLVAAGALRRESRGGAVFYVTIPAAG